jgi:hypothetical protein
LKQKSKVESSQNLDDTAQFEKEYTAYLEEQLKIMFNLKLKTGKVLTVICFCIATVF